MTFGERNFFNRIASLYDSSSYTWLIGVHTIGCTCTCTWFRSYLVRNWPLILKQTWDSIRPLTTLHGHIPLVSTGEGFHFRRNCTWWCHAHRNLPTLLVLVSPWECLGNVHLVLHSHAPLPITLAETLLDAHDCCMDNETLLAWRRSLGILYWWWSLCSLRLIV